MILKKEKGFTLIEIIISSSILLMISLGIFNVINTNENRRNIDEIAYTAATKMFHLSEIANLYINDKIDTIVPSEFDINTLKEEGYIDEVKDFHILPFGREIKFYSNNDYGFSLSIAMMATGDMDEKLLKIYNMDNEFGHILYENKVSSYLSEMVKNKNYNIGVIDPDYNMKWSNSNTSFNLNPFIKKETTDISNKYSTSLFFNLQKEPGFFVLNYISSAYRNINVAELSSHSSLYAIGYSAFCPEPNIKMNASDFNNTLNPISLYSAGSGDNFFNIYLCLPVSQIDLEDDLDTEIPLLNEFNRRFSIKGSCLINGSRDNIIEFRLRNNYYTFQTSSGQANLTCYRPYQPTYESLKINSTRYPSTTSKTSLILPFSGSYKATVPSVTINRVNLNDI